MARHAVALRRITLVEELVAGKKGEFLANMDEAQFLGWEGVLVRAATPEEIAAQFGEQTAAMTVAEYVDRYLAGEGRGDTPDDIALQQFAANHATAIEQEFADRAAAADAPEQQRSKRR